MSWCTKLKNAIRNDSTWKATIVIPSSLGEEINKIIFPNDLLLGNHIDDNMSLLSSSSSIEIDDHNKNITQDIVSVSSNISNFSCDETIKSVDSNQNSITSNYEKSSHIDIVNLIGILSPKLTSFLKDVAITNSYPKNAIFLFEGYNSFESKQKLIDDIKLSAFNNGTILSISKTDKKRPKNPYFTITLQCIHFGKPKKTKVNSELKFSEQCLQADMTIIEEAHKPSSYKNRSRNSCYSRVNLNNSTIVKKLNRTTTKKCKCSFSLSIFYDDNTQKWYLKKKRLVYEDPRLHSNHIWIHPNHLTIGEHITPKNILSLINTLLDSGMYIPSIQTHIKKHHNFNVDYHLIYKMRTKKFDELIYGCVQSPQGSTVDKLIKLFERTKSVSFVYIKHVYNSGFVTFRKKRNNQKEQYVTDINNNNVNQLSTKTIDNWRDSLKLSTSNDVLVAFAWAHDEEIKSVEKFPEFLAADITFNVNKERRELFVLAGIDGNNKAFTALRCFIPSKQEQAYTWIMNEALTHLLTANILKHNQCISCDQEFALNASINTTIDSSKPSFSNSKMRLDCFHFFTKVWIEKVRMKSYDTTESINALNIMRSWILTWFNYTESKNEFDISIKNFRSYFKDKKDLIGNVSSFELNTLISKIVSKQKLLLNHHFVNVCTFDFLGDSIVEGINFHIKKGPLKVTENMNLAVSGFNQIKSTEITAIKKSIASAKKINSTGNWTKSLTKDYLTEYAEGIACDNFDRRLKYVKKRIDDNTWLVCYSKFLTFDKEYDDSYLSKPTKFVRLREVSLSQDNFMSCTCNYPKRWLMPCVHICTVIDSCELYTADLFHLRWWKHFNYMFKKGHSKHDKLTRLSLEESVNLNRDNHFEQRDGKYKGIPLNGTTLYEALMNNIHHDTDQNDIEYSLMTTLNRFRVLSKHIQKYSHDHISLIKDIQDDHIYGIDDNSDNDVINSDNMLTQDNEYPPIGDEDVNTIETMGVGSQVESNLSSFRDSMQGSSISRMNNRSTIKNGCSNVYSKLHPSFEQLVKSISSEEQLKLTMNALEKLSFENIKQNKKRKAPGSTDTTFLGEMVPSRSSKGGRHKYKYERYGNASK